MTTFEFQAALLSNGHIAVPSDIAGQIPAGKPIRITLSCDAPIEHGSIHTLGRKLFEESRSTEASVYDSLA